MKGKMTVKEFLEKGYKFVEEDSFMEIQEYPQVVGIDIPLNLANVPDFLDLDEKRFVISAKALQEIEQQPMNNKINTVYEEATFEKLSEAFAAHEETPLYSYHCDGYGIASSSDIIVAFETDGRSVYRKVETASMEAAKMACKSFLKDSKQVNENSDFKLFLCYSDNKEDGDFDGECVELCRTIVDAYDGKGE